jgi:hypothetical protein
VARSASLIPLALVAASFLACTSEVPVPGKERIGTYLLQSVGDPLSNDCAPAILDAGLDAGAVNGTFVDSGVILSVTYNATTLPDGGTVNSDGSPVEPYDAGFLTFAVGSGSQYGVIVGQVLDVAGVAPRVFSGCTCTAIDPPAILVEERNTLVLLSPSQVQALNSTAGCVSLSVLLDGGIPSGPTITPPRSVDGIWDVSLVCGVTEERVTVLGPGCSGNCTSCTIQFAVQGKPQ